MVAQGLYQSGSCNVVVFDKEQIRELYKAGCYGSSATTSSLKPLFMREKRRRFRDLDADSSWAEPWKLNLIEAFYMICQDQLEVRMVGNAEQHENAHESGQESEKETLSKEAAWRVFSTSSAFKTPDNFACMYAAYASLKNQGWVVKLGSTYGAHFVVYQGDPDFFHSQFCVIIRNIASSQKLDWLETTREMRVANQTAKELILGDVQLEEPSSVPECRARTDFIILLRWMLKHEEAGKERTPHKKLKRKLIDPSQKQGKSAKGNNQQKKRKEDEEGETTRATSC